MQVIHCCENFGIAAVGLGVGIFVQPRVSPSIMQENMQENTRPQRQSPHAFAGGFWFVGVILIRDREGGVPRPILPVLWMADSNN